MIDIRKILLDVSSKNADDFAASVAKGLKSDEDDTQAQARVYQAILSYSNTLLEKYHAALKDELAKQNIHI